MRKNFLIFGFLFFVAIFVFNGAFLTFFAQDDFILISQFSGHGLLTDILRAFGPPQVTHWRPFHNLYFLISGDLFGKDFFWYHFFTFLIHSAAAFGIYKCLKSINLSGRIAIFAALLYTLNPSHFNTYYWISGGATAIGFCFLIFSFYAFLKKKRVISLLLFATSLLASESMIVGIGIFVLYEFLFKNRRLAIKSNIGYVAVGIVFVILKLILTPKSTFDTYNIGVSAETFTAVKFYVLRSLGFAGVSQDRLLTVILLVWIFVLVLMYLNEFKKNFGSKIILFFTFIFILGLFPFVLIPSHLSGNYMNISIFAVSSFWALALGEIKARWQFVMVLVFIFIAFFSVKIIEDDNWVIKRAYLAFYYISQIEKSNPPNGSTLIFNDNYISTSYDAYIALGTGKAVNFWFKDKNYNTCFSAFENCSVPENSNLPGSANP